MLLICCFKYARVLRRELEERDVKKKDPQRIVLALVDSPLLIRGVGVLESFVPNTTTARSFCWLIFLRSRISWMLYAPALSLKLFFSVCWGEKKVADVWEVCGADPARRFTWDTQKNDNRVFDGGFKPRARYDRCA